MSAQRINLSPGSISMSNRMADKLISLGSGDAALLFLHLLRTGGLYDPYTAAKTLGWEASRVTTTFAELENLELVKGTTVEQTPTASAKDAPDYTAADISQELENKTSSFGPLLREVERALGKNLSTQDTSRLLELYDHLALPSEVIFLLVNHMVQEAERRYGPGRRPRMSEIKREGYRWASKGLDTLEAADAYIKKLEYFRTMEGEILSTVGIHDRQANAQEQRYINAWLEMGFPLDSIVLACQKTLLNLGIWKWVYCNGILQDWHRKKLHTVEEIVAAEEAAPSAHSSSSKPSQGQSSRSKSNPKMQAGQTSNPDVIARQNEQMLRLREQLSQEEDFSY